MGRMPVPDRLSALSSRGCPPPEPWRIIRRFHRLSACRGLVAYALRTRAPLSCLPKEAIPFDLHVLGLPLAFILSQDQTLRCTIVFLLFLLWISGSAFVQMCSFSRVRVTPSRLTRTVFLCWPQAFKELCASSSPQSYPSFLGEADCKGTTFFNIGNQKNQLFLIKYYICLSFNDIKIIFHKEMGWIIVVLFVFDALGESENGVLAGLNKLNGTYNDEICKNGFRSPFINMCHLLEFLQSDLPMFREEME